MTDTEKKIRKDFKDFLWAMTHQTEKARGMLPRLVRDLYPDYCEEHQQEIKEKIIERLDR